MSDVGYESGLGRRREAIRNQKRHEEPDFGHLGRPEANEGVAPLFLTPRAGAA